MTTTLFVNARFDIAGAADRVVLVLDGRIAAAGPAAALDAHADVRVDCGGALLAPALLDAHCHVLAAAAATRSVDCSPAAVRSVGEIVERVRAAAASAGPGAWVRAVGYDETQLEERRHPTRRDLDEASPAVPVRLLHRSGHAAVLNTRAMQLADIGNETPEPPGGAIDRFLDTGEPSGLLFEMNDVIDRVVPPLPYSELAAGVAEVSRQWLASGVTALCDATHTNGAAEHALFARLRTDGALPLDVTLMEGAAHAGEMPAAGADVRRGHVKIMLSELGGALAPDERELHETVARLHAAGRDVAVHAIEERAVAAALDAIEAALAAAPRGHRHRIEHAALLPPGGARRIAALGVIVVTQPGFIFHSGDRYMREIAPDRHGALYPAGDLLRAGARVAASSDAPVTPVDAMAAISTAMLRRTASGAALGPEQAVPWDAALAMWTRDAAYALGLELERGSLAPGMAADFALIEGAPDAPRVVATFIGGERVFER